MSINGKQELQIETMGKVVQNVIKLKERKNKIINSRLKTLKQFITTLTSFKQS